MEHSHHHGDAELSQNQQLVMDVLDRSTGAMSAYMILDELRDSGFRAPLQVYRALEKLIAIGRVHRLESLNAFIACSHLSCEKIGVTAFVICDRCEHVQEVCDDSVSQFLADLAKKTKFQASKSSIELHGLCNACEAG
jgi:Fur family zinc uptake transcriptional regulator